MTRTNEKKLFQKYARTNVRKYCFSNRIVSVWNKLPNTVVGAKDINKFKNLLDDHLHDSMWNYED